MANKTLGQHFLKSEKVLRQIVATGEIVPGELVLEIGPGKGVLTRALLEAGAKVVAVEKDHALATFLEKTFEEEISTGALELIAGDILEIDVGEKIGNREYKIVANIPYYITGAVIRKFLSGESGENVGRRKTFETKSPSRMVLLVQKEVAERIVARDGKESLLSLAVKAYGRPRKIATIRRGDFSPPPKVDSAVLLIDEISGDFFTGKISGEKFFTALHAGFAHKRKKLIRNLEPVAPLNKARQLFAEIGLSEGVRAENLDLETWRKLVEKI